MNKNLLLSYGEYAKMHHETPYLYRLESKGQLLYYFGAQHSRDPEHPQYKLLVEKWGEFIHESQSQRIKTAVVIEAFEISAQRLSLEECVKRYGERGAGAYMADKDKALLVFGEPKMEDVVLYLLKKYSKEEIVLFFECVALNFWHNNKTGKSIEEFLASHTEKYRILLNWPDLVISTQFIQEIYKRVTNQELHMQDGKVFGEITSPTVTGSRINELSRSQSLYRNEYLLDQIEKYWNEGYNLFIVYGAGHAVMQEPVLRDFVV